MISATSRGPAIDKIFKVNSKMISTMRYALGSPVLGLILVTILTTQTEPSEQV